jgi:hypothetical protein
MAILLSTGLRTKLLDTNSLEGLFSTARISIYSGTVPSSADDAVGGTVLVTIAEGGAALTFGTAASGAMQKSANTWSGTIANTGTATFWRMHNVADTSGTAADATQYRIQGTIGTSGADGNLSSTTLTAAGTQYIDFFSVGIPAS